MRVLFSFFFWRTIYHLIAGTPRARASTHVHMCLHASGVVYTKLEYTRNGSKFNLSASEVSGHLGAHIIYVLYTVGHRGIDWINFDRFVTSCTLRTQSTWSQAGACTASTPPTAHIVFDIVRADALKPLLSLMAYLARMWDGHTFESRIITSTSTAAMRINYLSIISCTHTYIYFTSTQAINNRLFRTSPCRECFCPSHFSR